MLEKLLNSFEKVFGEGEEIHTYFSPGRVNLIGEHTDYNGGHVFPCALTIGTYVAARRRNDFKILLYSVNYPAAGIVEADARDVRYSKSQSWGNYPLGIVWTLRQKGYAVNGGFELAIYGNIPNGSGLSSSASVEIGTLVALSDLFGLDIDMVEASRLGQYSENHFNGVNCGIMDQFAIAMGKKDHAIFLDTSTLEYEYAPIRLEDAKIVIASSNKKRGLGDSKYNERRSQCEQALADLQKVVPIHALGELTNEEFARYESAIADPICAKRAKHAVAENRRTVEAVSALKAGNLRRFGELMNESHISLRDDYEVTGKELDALVEAAWQQEGVIGSRMTGAGFGGCTVSIVKDDAVDSFIQNVGEIYENAIGYAADFYVVEVGDGAGKLSSLTV